MYQQPPQYPMQQQPFMPAPPPKDPSMGMILELIGFFGFLGIGWIWAGETAIGLALLIGWWIFLTVEVLLMFVVIGFCLTPLNLAVPIISGVILMNRLKARQAAVTQHFM